MATVDQLKAAFLSLPIRGQHVIAHGSSRALSQIPSGPHAVVQALVATAGSVLMPAFTFNTMVTPLVGPPNNAIDYAAEEQARLEREKDPNYVWPVPFTPDLPVSPEVGVLSDVLRRLPTAKRSSHPILSFTGVNADFALNRQTIFDPLAPIAALAEKGGWVVLIGAGHEMNVSIHYAEKLAGRRQFVRWALTPKRVVECPNFPGDSSGFDAITPLLKNDVDVLPIGQTTIQAIRLARLIEVVKDLIKKDPLALLCERKDCAYCKALRGGPSSSAIVPR